MKCAICGKPALYYSKVKHKRVTDNTHDLCRRCYVAERQRMSQSRLSKKEEDYNENDLRFEE